MEVKVARDYLMLLTLIYSSEEGKPLLMPGSRDGFPRKGS